MTFRPQRLSGRILTALSSTSPRHYSYAATRTATKTMPLPISSHFHQIRAHPFLFFTHFSKTHFPISPVSVPLYLSCLEILQCGGVFVLNAAGQARALQNSASYIGVKVNCPGLMTVESLRLVPVGEKVISYFSERKISEDILRRNAVMQISGDENAIAFTYRRNGVLVTCKYRSLDKKFWQEKGEEKILYGIDDIKGADEVIIVEGEIDKLSMEEAGFLNCVSVPDGAPQKVSAKLPSLEKDSRFQYLWNCKEHLDKASRIILATDGDPPGKVLAEEVARRLGRERCWRVCWPKKDEFSYYKDANEVLMNLGSAALRDVVHSAELYRMHNFDQVP